MAATKEKQIKQGTLRTPTTEYYQVRYSPVSGQFKGQTRYGIVRRYYDETPKSKKDKAVHFAALSGHLLIDDMILPVCTKVAEVVCVVAIDFDDDGCKKWLKDDFKQAEALAKKAGKGVQVGKMFSIGVGDGQATYVVTAVNGSKCDVEWRGWHNGDRYTDHYFGWGRKGVPVSTVAKYIRMDEGMAALFAKSEPDFIESQPVGTIVHYDNSFGKYVRCEIVKGTPAEWNDDDRDPPTKMLKAIAIVGDWKKHDLPRYTLEGVVAEDHYVTMIRTGELFLVNPSNLYESPDYSEERKTKGKANPATLKPHHTFPPMPTPEQEKQFAAWRAVNATKQALEAEWAETEAEFKARTKHGFRKTKTWDYNDPKANLREALRRLNAAKAEIEKAMKA